MKTLPVGLVYCKRQFDNFFWFVTSSSRQDAIMTSFYREMPSFFKNVRRRQLLLNLYLFLCNLAIALAFLKIWSDKTKLSKRFDSKKYAKKVKQMC